MVATAAAAIVLIAGVLTACGSSPGSPPPGVSLARKGSGTARLAKVHFQPLPSVIRLSDAQIARIKG
jgi:hypothetical protein